MPDRTEVVVTGVGIVSPIGIGSDAFWTSLIEARSGISPIQSFDATGLPVRIAGQVLDFDPKQYVRPRKSLKVMARDTQLGVAAAELACLDAGLTTGKIDPERLGVVFGADVIATELHESLASYRSCLVDGRFDFDRWGPVGMHEAFPLLFLKILPNMIASHIAIAQDARGPNNTLHQGDVSSLLALSEAVRVIERGWADAMIAGGASSRMQPFDWVRGCLTDELSRHDGDPAEACRPFDALRSGAVRGEGSAALLLESRPHAQARGATILATIRGTASASETHPRGNPPCGCGLGRAIRGALRDARLEPSDVGHVNAHGTGTIQGDVLEASVIEQVLNSTPVTAPKSYFGNVGAAAGGLEMAASVLALKHGLVPPTLNYTRPDARCPVNLVHGQPLAGTRPTALVLNQTVLGQAAALLLTAE